MPAQDADTYLVVIGRTRTGYSAHCPGVDGCGAVGKTVDEVLVNMREALELHLEGMVEDGDTIPKPSSLESYRDVLKGTNFDQYLLAHVQIDTSHFALPVTGA